MRILVDLGHPAHVHFFRHPLHLWRERGHEVLVTSRDKECALDLLDQLGIAHRALSAQGDGSTLGLLGELWRRDRALAGVARSFRPDVMTGIGGTFVAHVGAWLRIPSVIFYDTENAHLQNAITYPLASCVVVPDCYRGWLPPRRHRRYHGFHELAYLAPERFAPDRDVALAAGLAERGDTFLVRLVSWRASHDIGERGWSRALLGALVDKLTRLGTVVISAEGGLDDELAPHAYRGAAADLHHLMAFSRACVGESATVASECAVLGVPAVYAAATGRGYTDEQERRFGLVRNVRTLEWGPIEAAVDAVLALTAAECRARRARLLEACVDVAGLVADTVETFPAGRSPGRTG